MSATQPYIPRAGERAPRPDRFRTSRRAELKIWWREIDRVLLFLILALMAIGAAAVAAASPASASRLSTSDQQLPDLYFYWAHLRWQLLGLAAMFGAAMLSRENARRAGIVLFAGMFAMLVLVPIAGYEVNGARRWIDLGVSFQPSEFLKPAFVITLAWIIAWRARDPNIPVVAIATAIMGAVGVLLMMQPNLGDTVLFAGVWFALVVLSGVSTRRLGAVIGGGLVAGVLVYLFYENGRNRINDFLGGGTAFDQVDLAQRTLLAGGWTGSGLWLGIRKMSLPEAHTDYIFSVIGEEFGLLVCAVIVLLYLAIVVRVLVRLADEEDLFTLLAGAGLAVLIGGQAFINILVNLQLAPSKGMTLPLVSYGGSSTIAVCLTVGLLLAITRRNPFLKRGRPGVWQRLFGRESRQ
ncbi:FtsW/RodA/SpoVE family cell cycle protein [Pelagerythrobacter marinus]|jgi:cell division protein FtsW|uniref:FtsW/RodA/SpoVE family cell cycle protein n=1 Tax=Pelagerythrobacter marinus TaxID=538382 RepID=UPI0020368736|nr:putative peptidoglycan glycosyltransferase FtsW [Pelagerythrobacter marinus]USA40001.1 putative lipid II flippase FtsW [Pelagerythrobacter marinus]WPZ05878.1 putative peptidoglycan glycosyltransferase FtsW [Pelagerythrobacter marinus]